MGLDVVKSKIESLSGEVEVKSKWGEGSTWTIRLPLTLAIIQALMVVVGGEKICDLSGIHPDDRRYLSQRYQTGRKQRSDQLKRNRDSSDPSD